MEQPRIPITRFRTQIVEMFLLMLAVQGARVAFGLSEPEAADRLPLSKEPVAPRTVRKLPERVQWQGRDYNVETGIEVLMGVVQDATQTEDEQHRALLGLAMLRQRLEGRPCLEELAKHYENASELHKGAILVCLQGSEDPRGIAVFMRALQEEQNIKLRLWAAEALANWNIRRGVREMVSLTESDAIVPPPSRMPFARDNALDSFSKCNARKGWGFPEEEVRKSIEARPGLDRVQFVALYAAEIKKWFAENEHRFPDWKLGDPLPNGAEEPRPPNEVTPGLALCSIVCPRGSCQTRCEGRCLAYCDGEGEPHCPCEPG